MNSVKLGNMEAEVRPPAKMKVFAPNGDTVERICWMGVRRTLKPSSPVEVFLLHLDQSTEVLNKRVVVQNLETGMVVYNPRLVPPAYGGAAFLSPSDLRWLEKNPHWPDVLELEDNPVEEEGDQDGLYA